MKARLVITVAKWPPCLQPSAVAFFFLYAVLPHFRQHPLDLGLYLGHSQLLHCEAGGYPKPTTIWYKSGIEVTASNYKILGVLITAIGDLLVRDAQLSQTGAYYCVAISSVGVTQSKVAQVDVFSECFALLARERGEEREKPKRDRQLQMH